MTKFSTTTLSITQLRRWHPDLLTITFNGLSKTYRVAGFRQGVDGVERAEKNTPKVTSKVWKCWPQCACVLTFLRNTPFRPRWAVIRASVNLLPPGGRLYEQRNRAWELINDIPGVSCVKPRGALYMFPKIDAKRFNIHDDQKMVLDFLLQEKSSVGARGRHSTGRGRGSLPHCHATACR